MRFTVEQILRIISVAAAFVCWGVIWAGNVDVSTIPRRERVQLTIYNSEDITLVRETRNVTLKQGVNPLQFSWANTLIDSSSVQLRFLEHRDQLDLLDTTFPYDRPQLLEWNVKSAFDGEASLEITYFTSGIFWAADYVCISDVNESVLGFEGFVRVVNESGEDYREAQIRLVVGTISLVEEIRDLAERGIIDRGEAEKLYLGAPVSTMAPGSKDATDALRGQIKNKMNEFGGSGGGGGGGSLFSGGGASEPKVIEKESLSEYFIYSVEGTETIPHGWAKRLRLFEGLQAPFSIEYRWRPAEYGDQLVRMFILRNDEKSKLGTTPLPDGVVRLFRHNGRDEGRDGGRDGLAFMIEQSIEYVPIGQEIELNLGRDPDVVHDRLVLGAKRENFWFSAKTPKRFFSPTQGDKIDPNYEIAGWDQRLGVVERIRNYRSKPIKVQFRLSIDGDIAFESALKPLLHDFQSPQFEANIESGQSQDLAYTIVQRLGINQKQSRVELKP